MQCRTKVLQASGMTNRDGTDRRRRLSAFDLWTVNCVIFDFQQWVVVPAKADHKGLTFYGGGGRRSRVKYGVWEVCGG